ncbi:MAG: flavin reductase family protein [Deltaproteobacteria bacterium]|nr:MAG: flavin reductase family protein [Deltaproteobacteria bacterium]
MQLSISKWYKILAPRPVVLISTVNIRNNPNAAPFSFVMPCSTEPPLVAFASDPDHHTVKNILETKDFVVNIPSRKLLKQLWTCANDFPYGVSEIKKANLTEEKSIKVKSPKIKECFAHLECKLYKHYRAGDHLLIVGKVLRADIDEKYLLKKQYSITKADPLMHISGTEFGVLGKVIKVR